MPKRILAVFDFNDGELRARGLTPAGAARAAISEGVGAFAVEEISEGTWGLLAGPRADLLEPTGFRVTARNADEAERGCLAAASAQRQWGGCSIVRDEDVPALLALSAA